MMTHSAASYVYIYMNIPLALSALDDVVASTSPSTSLPTMTPGAFLLKVGLGDI